jgi:hypothetical protein
MDRDFPVAAMDLPTMTSVGSMAMSHGGNGERAVTQNFGVGAGDPAAGVERQRSADAGADQEGEPDDQAAN